MQSILYNFINSKVSLSVTFLRFNRSNDFHEIWHLGTLILHKVHKLHFTLKSKITRV